MANLISNGDFETSDISIWSEWSWDETLAHDTVDPIGGDGSLKVTTTGNEDEEGTRTSNILVADGLLLHFSATVRGEGTILVGSGTTPHVQETVVLSTTPSRVSGSYTTAVEQGSVRVYVHTNLNDPQAVVFWIDDVWLGDTAPPEGWGEYEAEEEEDAPALSKVQRARKKARRR